MDKSYLFYKSMGSLREGILFILVSQACHCTVVFTIGCSINIRAGKMFKCGFASKVNLHGNRSICQLQKRLELTKV